MMDKDRLKEIKDRADQAKPGPWTYVDDAIYEDRYLISGHDGEPLICTSPSKTSHDFIHPSDGVFCAAARSDVPDLLEHIADLEDELYDQKKMIQDHKKEIADLEQTIRDVLTERFGPA